jgi:hypothetical protein
VGSIIVLCRVDDCDQQQRHQQFAPAKADRNELIRNSHQELIRNSHQELKELSSGTLIRNSHQELCFPGSGEFVGVAGSWISLEQYGTTTVACSWGGVYPSYTYTGLRPIV